jgi:hypothetical protein
MRHRDERCALVVEVIRNHAYEKSRFLNGAAIQQDKIPSHRSSRLYREERRGESVAQATRSALPLPRQVAQAA